MRVTQSMLSNNMLRNLTKSYSKMGTLQEQINTGKKISKPSQDPVVAIKGMGYRTDLEKVEQFQRNIGEVNNWLDSSDDSLDKVGLALQRVQELVTDAANDTKTPEDRAKIQKEISQLRDQIQSLGNTRVGDKYIFSGTKTLTPLFSKDVGGNVTIGGTVPSAPPTPGFNNEVNIAIYDGIELTVNSKGYDMFRKIDEMMVNIESSLDLNKIPVSTGVEIGKFLKNISDVTDTVLEERAEIGARQNRVEMMENRLGMQEVIVTKQLSNNEDIDYEKAITEMITQESIHRAALS
ncbi:MAG: flagellar hook-associated protein FlgL, partial [Candidatus Bathyarchaeia archaeon]